MICWPEYYFDLAIERELERLEDLEIEPEKNNKIIYDTLPVSQNEINQAIYFVKNNNKSFFKIKTIGEDEYYFYKKNKNNWIIMKNKLNIKATQLN
jgi:hypothetical protein